MAEADRYLFLGSLLTPVGDARDIERRRETGPVSTVAAMDEDRLVRGLENLNKFSGALLRKVAAGGHSEIDMGNAELLGR